MNRRFELTETGADAHALRSEDQGGILFDLGLGLLQVDAFVRATDSAVASALRRHVGKPVFAAESAAMAVILDANPHRVFVSRAGHHFAFQVMLERYGDAERAALKKRLISAVLAGDEPFAIEPNGDRFRRATAWVTLRQLQASGAKSATLAAWLAAYDRAERVEGSCV